MAERMGFRDGELLDVTVRWPKTEDYDPEDTLDPVPEKHEKGKRTRKEE